MPDSFLDLLIQHYLRGERNSPSLRGQLHETPPATIGRDATTAKPSLQGQPHKTPPAMVGRMAKTVKPLPNQLGVSIIPMIDIMGNKTSIKTSDNAVLWAQNTTQVLGRIDPEDQTDIVERYGNFKSMFVDAQRMIPGMFYTFNYRATTVKHYDRFPVILVLDRTPNSILGMNFHYLPPKLRFALFESMMPLIVPLPVFQLSRILLTYKTFKRRRMLGKLPTIKRYTPANIRGRAAFISPLEWAVALAYPSERFIETTPITIWAESRRRLY